MSNPSTSPESEGNAAESEGENAPVTAIDGIPVPTESKAPSTAPSGDRVTAIDGIPVPTESQAPSGPSEGAESENES